MFIEFIGIVIDHNLTHIGNQVALVGLFLSGRMDKLTATRGCPGLSYLNSCERAMPILNIGLSALSLTIDPNCEKWLMEDVLNGANSMKSVRKNIADYDSEITSAISALKRRLMNKNKVQSKEESNKANENDQDLHGLVSVGCCVQKKVSWS